MGCRAAAHLPRTTQRFFFFCYLVGKATTNHSIVTVSVVIASQGVVRTTKNDALVSVSDHVHVSTTNSRRVHILARKGTQDKHTFSTPAYIYLSCGRRHNNPVWTILTHPRHCLTGATTDDSVVCTSSAKFTRACCVIPIANDGVGASSQHRHCSPVSRNVSRTSDCMVVVVEGQSKDSSLNVTTDGVGFASSNHTSVAETEVVSPTTNSDAFRQRGLHQHHNKDKIRNCFNFRR